MTRNITDLPLHGGSAPQWLVKRMIPLAEAIIDLVIAEYGRTEFLRRLANPYWFQSFSCAIGYDWHSSGTTTVTMGILKTILNPNDYGIYVSGGKGKKSRETIKELEQLQEIFNLSTKRVEELQRTSRLVAKIDNTAVQDGYQLYHHNFVVSEDGEWLVIQQGMNPVNKYARRYHWYSQEMPDFFSDPHSGIITATIQKNVLDMSAKKSETGRKTILDLLNDHPKHLKRDLLALQNLKKNQSSLDRFINSDDKLPNHISITHDKYLFMPKKINWDSLEKVYELSLDNFEHLLLVSGLGPSTLRALALVGELIYGAEFSWKDPAKFSFAHGGKDGVPYPVDLHGMEKTTEILQKLL